MKADLKVDNSDRAWDIFGPVVMCQAPYRVIYADPPWPTRTVARNGNGHRTKDGKRSFIAYASDPYHTMTRDQIINLPVPELCDPEGTRLILWCPWPHLALGFEVMSAWGFEYSTGCPWLKTSQSGEPVFGLGFMFRHCTEPLLIGNRGKVGGWAGNATLGLFKTVREQHSAKPQCVADWIDQRFEGPRIELFARRPRGNWVVWGNEVEAG